MLVGLGWWLECFWGFNDSSSFESKHGKQPIPCLGNIYNLISTVLFIIVWVRAKWSEDKVYYMNNEQQEELRWC